MNPHKLLFPALLVGIVAAVACLIAALSPALRPEFYEAYLFAYLFILGLALGGLALPMLHTLTGGDWGITVRRIAEAASLTLPLMAVLFLPLLPGLHHLYPWADPAKVASEEVLRHRQPYLNEPFFLIRAAVYFAIWIALAFIQITLARRIEHTGSPSARTALRGWSAAGLILYLLTMTHASIDWIMSRDIEFYSTTFGFITTVGQTLAAACFSVILLALINRSLLAASAGGGSAASPRRRVAASPPILNDLGNILLTLVILWAYVSFMQLLVIWMGNTGEDNNYYLQRGLGQPSPWRWIALALVVVHFFVPFFLLLFRATKRYLPALTAIAGVLFLAHILDVLWLVAPSGDHAGPRFHLTWLHPVALLAVGGLWFALFALFLPERLAAASGALETSARLEEEEAAHA
jgi:hypothetical protein